MKRSKKRWYLIRFPQWFWSIDIFEVISLLFINSICRAANVTRHSIWSNMKFLGLLVFLWRDKKMPTIISRFEYFYINYSISKLAPCGEKESFKRHLRNVFLFLKSVNWILHFTYLYFNSRLELTLQMNESIWRLVFFLASEEELKLIIWNVSLIYS